MSEELCQEHSALLPLKREEGKNTVKKNMSFSKWGRGGGQGIMWPSAVGLFSFHTPNAHLREAKIVSLLRQLPSMSLLSCRVEKKKSLWKRCRWGSFLVVGCFALSCAIFLVLWQILALLSDLTWNSEHCFSWPNHPVLNAMWYRSIGRRQLYTKGNTSLGSNLDRECGLVVRGLNWMLMVPASWILILPQSLDFWWSLLLLLLLFVYITTYLWTICLGIYLYHQ